MLATPQPNRPSVEEVASKPNRAAIILAIGERGELSFKDLKAKMNLGVGTLYYHLDGLKGLVTQNSSKQYMLTDDGRAVYASMKGMGAVGRPEPRTKFPSPRAVLGEAFLFDSHVERLAIDSMSNLSITIGVLVTAAALAGVTRLYDAIFFVQGRSLTASAAFFTVPVSWVLLFGMTYLLVVVAWKSAPSIPGLFGGCSLALVPVVFAMVLEALRKTFAPNLDFLGMLFVFPYYPLFQAVLVIWAAYIFTVSVRSASDLNLEKALVVTLLIVILNLGYLTWIRPILLH